MEGRYPTCAEAELDGDELMAFIDHSPAELFDAALDLR
jgi:hypothetical protein